MDAERWQQIARLLDEAFDRAPEERAAFLDRACAGDTALRAEVEALLAADEQAGTFLGAPAAEQAAPLVAGMEPSVAGPRRIGPYHTLRLLGRGGMGEVYLAERADDQFDRQVALKLVRPGLTSHTLRRRFLYERQILARLQHPHIARLYDGGVTRPAPGDPGEEQPYFAMEYVDGVPLTTYCDTRRLTIDERLHLFEQVGEAVAYAHRNLVVHRDLKPSNILVTQEGRVKLLDFGVAKLLEEEPGTATLTRTGLQAMTPEYAAPEQVRGEAVSTTTDVYALGVVLYELLTGHRPYRIARHTPGEIERVILEQEPERPSTAISRVEERRSFDGTTTRVTPEAIGRARNTPVDRLRRRLSGDLDTVLLKALRKEPERRYASVEAFVEDLRRYLAGLPVSARRDTPGYRARMFVRRHRAGVLATAAALLSLVGGLAVAVWQARTAATERDRARTEATRAEQVSDFLVNLFDMSDPLSSTRIPGDTLTARTILARGAARLDRELAAQPVVQTELLSTVGQVYLNLNMFPEAEALLQSGLDRRRRIYGSGHPEVAAGLSLIGQLRQAQSDYAAAETLHREALALRHAAWGDAHADVAESQYHLALALAWQEKDLDEAERLFRAALATRRRLLGPEHLDVVYTLNALANVLMDTGRHAEAETYHREVLAARRALLDAGHPSIAVSLNNLALTLRNQERYDEAEPLYREALGILRRQLGPTHTLVGIGLNNLADVLSRQGKYAAADPLFRDAIAVFQALFPEGHALEAVIRSKWGACLTELGDYATAEPELLYGYDGIARAFGPDHSFTENARARLVSLYEAWGRSEAAARWRQTAY